VKPFDTDQSAAHVNTFFILIDREKDYGEERREERGREMRLRQVASTLVDDRARQKKLDGE